MVCRRPINLCHLSLTVGEAHYALRVGEAGYVLGLGKRRLNVLVELSMGELQHDMSEIIVF